MLPRQRILKRITQVEQAPCNDNIVVQSHVKTDLEMKKGFMNDLLEKKCINIYIASPLDIGYSMYTVLLKVKVKRPQSPLFLIHV